MWSSQDFSLKTLLNKRVTDSLGKSVNNEFGDFTINVHAQELWLDGISSIPPGITTGPLKIYANYVLTQDVSVSGAQAWFASGLTGLGTDRLKNWVSDKYNSSIYQPGQGYSVQLYTGFGTQVPISDASNWLFDYVTGILVFGGLTVLGVPVASNGPYSITAYRYVGRTGLSTIGGLLSGTIGANQVAYGVGSSNYLTGSNNFVFTGSNVGIGTSTPTQTFHIQGTSRFTGAIYDSTNSPGFANSVLVSTVTGIAWTYLQPGSFVSGTISGFINTSQVAYGGGINSIIGSNNLWFTGTNLGIGTSSPTQPLQIQGNIRVTGSLYDSNNSAGGVGQVLGSTGTGIGWTTAGGSGTGNINGALFAQQIVVAVNSNTITGFTTFIYYQGNVGIGTATPTQPLHVLGNTRLQGSLYDSANFSGTSGQILTSTVGGIAWSSFIQEGIITGNILQSQVAFGAGNSQIQGSNNLWFNGTNLSIGTTIATQMLTIWGTSFAASGIAISYLNNAIFDASTLTAPGQSFIGVYKYGAAWQGNGLALVSQVLGNKVLGIVANANTLYFGNATDNIDFLTLNSTQSNFVDNNANNIFSINSTNGTTIQNSNLNDQKALYVSKNDILNTTSTSFIGISTIYLGINSMLTIEGMINGWSSSTANECGTYFAVFYNNGIGVSQVGSTDIVSKFSGIAGNFSVVGAGNSVFVMVKSPTGNNWFWRNHYKCFLTQNN